VIPQPEIRCLELVDELTEWRDGAMSPDRRSLIEEHLSICPDCSRYLDQTRAAIAAARIAELGQIGDVLRDAVLAALRARRA
jgi:hypothetical protein